MAPLQDGNCLSRDTLIIRSRYGKRPARTSRVCFVLTFDFTSGARRFRLKIVTAQTFKPEIAAAIKAYEQYVVCLNKTPDEFEAALMSLMEKAIKAYQGRGPGLRHGIALDKHVTVILSQNDGPRPLCGVYFNLHSPYQKHLPHKPVRLTQGPSRGSHPKPDA